MKNYLNAAEKQTFILLSAAGTAIGTGVDQVGSHLPKEIVADFKRANSFLRRALTAWMAPMDTKTKQATLRQAAGVNIGVISDVTKRREQEEYVKYIRDVREEAYREGGRDYVYDLCEHTLAMVCRRCDGKCRDTCALYQAYQHFDIEFWNAHHPRCEYAGAGEVSV
ncbi:DUF5651 domain-containing protein [Alicyclobacillus acidoterrestris]|uniref:DUF5651 domain-containing protein n=1 Tax=Alicyclobacillus acidoterrestris TaxID=1450 RepID=UPI003F52F1A1